MGQLAHARPPRDKGKAGQGAIPERCQGRHGPARRSQDRDARSLSGQGGSEGQTRQLQSTIH